MLEQINYKIVDKNIKTISYGKGAELGMGLITAFGVVAIITIIVYKIYCAKTGDVTLPGGFKFKFTT